MTKKNASDEKNSKMPNVSPAPKSLLDDPLKIDPVTWKKVLEAQKRQEREQALPIPVVFPYVDMEEETEADRATDNNIKIGINMAKVDLETKLVLY